MGLRLASGLALTFLFGMVYALVFVIGIWFLPFSLFTLLLMIGFTLAMVLFQYGISPLIIRWIYDIEWMEYEEYQSRYPHLAQILDKVVSVQGIDLPKMGIIHDGNPNAFTFGWTKNSARVVITTGILNYLDEKEQQAVLAHELGHVVHSDFILMTVAFAIPLVLLTIARWAYYASFFSRRRDSDEGGTAALVLIAVAILSYIAYYIGYLVSFVISRIREYYADEHAGEVLQNPNALATGLVKIAYGLVADQGIEIKERNKSKVRGLKGLGIFDPSTAKHLAVESIGPSGLYSMESIQAAAAWDLFNPWAKYFEIFSTHPLPAKRIKRLNKLSREMGVTPEIDLSGAREIKEQQAGKSMAGEFLTDLTFKNLPTIIFLLFLLFSAVWLFGILGLYYIPIINDISLSQFVLLWAIGFYLIGFGIIARTLFKYRSGFEPKTVLELVTNVKVSPIRCEPAIIEGTIVGKGVPGYYFSDDLYFKDKTGLLYVDYRFGLGIVDFFWAIRRVPQLIGQTVRIKGWYRRGPTPYIQVDTIEAGGRSFRNYSKHITYIGAVICFIIGLVIFYFWFQL
ncbi:MAG: M48 family metalloprotease [Candidatus Lokiarchaeota archaeon]|nr:M48 family metalloprotease [Candidatus Lokiarchaeota archaeon]MBD3201444.1 M48 family metalloprotease [Candidatus Lokiarchaeota archaeon]